MFGASQDLGHTLKKNLLPGRRTENAVMPFRRSSFTPQRQVFVRKFNTEVLTSRHVVLYSYEDIDHSFSWNAERLLPNDKQQLDL